MIRRAKWWFASKIRGMAGVTDALAHLETRLTAVETRIDAKVDAAEAQLNARMDEVSRDLGAALERLIETVTAAVAELRGNDGMCALRHDLATLAGRLPPNTLGLIDNAILGAQRSRIRERHGALEIETDHPVAVTSPDHLIPWGTKQDNSREQGFNARLIGLVPGARLSLLDLGCSGGGLVRSMIEQGYLAAGVEGSDYSLRRLRAEWLTIPDFLFTADITKPFRLLSDRSVEGVKFAVVTLWEVVEHIAEPDLPSLFRNIDNHLMRGGLLILSVSPNSDVIEGVELHQTIRPRPWWVAFFNAIGWTDNPAIVAWFGDDLVRWEANAPNSFHFALSRAGETPVLTNRTRHLAACAHQGVIAEQPESVSHARSPISGR